MEPTLAHLLEAIESLRAERIGADAEFLSTHREHHEWIKGQIERQRAKNAFWQGLAEKSIPAIVWSLIVAGSAVAWAFVKQHFEWR